MGKDTKIAWCDHTFNAWIGCTNVGPGCDQFIDWVICGAESGPHRRPFDLAWARSLRDQCAEFDVPFFLKQTPGGAGRKGVIETPELDDKRWVQFPGQK